MHLWVIFVLAVLSAIVIDLGVFHRQSRRVRFRTALPETAACIALSLIFSFWVFVLRGHEAGLQFMTGYVVEKFISVDSILIFAVILRVFEVPAESQHRVLYSGVIGALLMRAAFVVAGVQLQRQFRPVLYLLGAILLLTGVRMLYSGAHKTRPESNWLVKLARRVLPISDEFQGEKFIVRQGSRWSATPPFLALLAVETMDIIFAIDSVQAVLAITRDSFIAYSSNVFAILGLRAIYFG